MSKPSFTAGIDIKANDPYFLLKPERKSMSLGIGENEEYEGRDESGNEDTYKGSVYVLKLDIEQQERNICWKSTSCTLHLTEDSFPGGAAIWTSFPEGIDGSGDSITFDPSSLEPGEYTVTARSEILPSYEDSCVVRVVRPVILTPDEGEVHLLGEEVKYVADVEPSGLSAVQYSWSLSQGTCSPETSSTEEFVTTLLSAGDIVVTLEVTLGNMICRTNRTIKSVCPEVTELSWKNDHELTIWGGGTIEDPVWVKKLGGEVVINFPGTYSKGASAVAELVVSASEVLSHATSVQVRGIGSKENFYAKGVIFRNWAWSSGELELLSSPLYNSVNYYDPLEILWPHRVAFCRDNVLVNILFLGQDERVLQQLARLVDRKLMSGGPGITRGDELEVPKITGIEFREKEHGGHGWVAKLDIKRNGYTIVVDQCRARAGADDTAVGVCFVTNEGIVAEMVPIQKEELKRIRVSYDLLQKKKTERRLNSGRTSPQELCENLLRAAPDLYKQHDAILRIMNEGDASCVPVLIAYTAPERGSLLQQDAVKALGVIGTPAAERRLIEMLKIPVVSQEYDEDEDAAALRRTIVYALGQIGGESSIPILQATASSKNEYNSVREFAQIAVERLLQKRGNRTHP
ncbi:MAG: HEAT repeat domain-containing protein [Kiritimatiellia bacterium]